MDKYTKLAEDIGKTAIHTQDGIKSMDTSLVDGQVTNDTQDWYKVISQHATGVKKPAPFREALGRSGKRPNVKETCGRRDALVSQFQANNQQYAEADFHGHTSNILKIPNFSIWGSVDRHLFLEPFGFWAPALSSVIGPAHKQLIMDKAEELSYHPASQPSDSERKNIYFDLERRADNCMIDMLRNLAVIESVVSKPPNPQSSQDWHTVVSTLQQTLDLAREETILRLASGQIVRFCPTFVFMKEFLTRESQRISLYVDLNNIRPLIGHWIRWAWPHFKLTSPAEADNFLRDVDTARAYSFMIDTKQEKFAIDQPTAGYSSPSQLDANACTPFYYNGKPAISPDPVLEMETASVPVDDVATQAAFFFNAMQKRTAFVPYTNGAFADAHPGSADHQLHYVTGTDPPADNNQQNPTGEVQSTTMDIRLHLQDTGAEDEILAGSIRQQENQQRQHADDLHTDQTLSRTLNAADQNILNQVAAAGVDPSAPLDTFQQNSQEHKSTGI